MSYSQIIGTWRFTVTIGGLQIPFQEVSGLTQEREVITYEHGELLDGSGTLNFPGKVKYGGALTCKKGAFKGENNLQDWYDSQERRTIIVSLLDEQQVPIITWTATNAWLKKLDAFNLNSGSSEALIETAEIVYDSYTVNKLV